MTPELLRLRRSAGYAAAKFEGLCGPANVGPCAELLASAIERCAAVGGGWAVTLDPTSVKLNAGPVRLLYIADGRVWFAATEEAGRVPSWLEEERQKRKGILYASVPVRTRAFIAPASKLRGLPKPVRAAFLSYVEEAVRRRRGPSLFIKAHSPSVLAFLNQLLGRHLPPPPGADELDDDSDPEDLSTAVDYVEGRRVTLVLDVHERDARARAACIEANGARCSACGMSFEEEYGALGEGFIEVHHMRPLAGARGPRKVDAKRDLVPICPNCHRMLHRRNPPLTPAELALHMRGGRNVSQ